MLRPKVPRNSADTLLKLVEQCAGIILNAAGTAPRVAVVLGSGFQGLASELDAEGGLAFEELPGFPSLGVPGHGGKLLWGSIGPLMAFKNIAEQLLRSLAGGKNRPCSVHQQHRPVGAFQDESCF